MKKFFLFFVLLLNFYFFASIAVAQFEYEEGAEEENIFLPQSPDQNLDSVEGGVEEENIFLNNDKKPTAQQTAKSPAQIANGKKSGIYEDTELACPYYFERDLEVGSKGADVKLLQVLLNKKIDTMIALEGPGSLGQETESFGEATKVSVKKFQNLYIEYIGLANGRFGPRTRTVMNQICGGKASVKSGNAYENVVSVQANATPVGEITTIPNDKVSPSVTLTANVTEIPTNSTFKVVANFSEEVKPITPDSVIVDGGSVKEIRKLSPTSFSISIIPDENTKNVLVQIEADKIEDLAGNLNENASNEINVKIKISGLNDLIDKVVDSAPVCEYDTDGKLITEDEETGTTINTEGCKENNTDDIKNDEDKYAKYNAKLGCYGNTKPLPEGIAENQRCNHPENPNNPSSPCSAQNQAAYKTQLLNYQRQIENDRYFGYGFGSALSPINPCTNQTIAAKTQNAAQQQHQQEKQSQGGGGGGGLGDMLGKIMQSLGGGNMFGGANDGAGSGVGDGAGSDQTPPASTAGDPQKNSTPTANPASSQFTSADTPTDGKIALIKDNVECKHIISEGKVYDNTNKYVVTQMIDVKGKRHVLLYPLSLINNNPSTDAAPGTKSFGKVSDCSLYKPNSLKEDFESVICCSKYDFKSKECVGKKTSLIGKAYSTNASQVFSSGSCVKSNPSNSVAP